MYVLLFGAQQRSTVVSIDYCCWTLLAASSSLLWLVSFAMWILLLDTSREVNRSRFQILLFSCLIDHEERTLVACIIAVHSIALHCTVYISSIVCVCYSGDRPHCAWVYSSTQHCTAMSCIYTHYIACTHHHHTIPLPSICSSTLHTQETTLRLSI